VSPQQSYKKQTSFGGLIPTYFAGTSSGLQAVGLVTLNTMKDLILNNKILRKKWLKMTGLEPKTVLCQWGAAAGFKLRFNPADF
jgi:hypothetical protein